MGPCTHTTHSVRTVCQGIIPFLPGRPKQLATKVGVSVFQRASMNEGGQGRAFLCEAGPFAQSPNDCRSPTGQRKANNVLTRVASLRKPGFARIYFDIRRNFDRLCRSATWVILDTQRKLALTTISSSKMACAQ